MFPSSDTSLLGGMRRDLNDIEELVNCQPSQGVPAPENIEIDDECGLITQPYEPWGNNLEVGPTSNRGNGQSLQDYRLPPIGCSEHSPHSDLTKATLRPFTTKYVSTRGLTKRDFETAMHPTFTLGKTILKPRLTDERTGTTEWSVGQIGVLQDVTLWSTEEREPKSSNMQARWSCSVSLDENRLGGKVCFNDRDSLRLQCITRNELDPFVPVQHRNASGTLLDKIRQSFMQEIGAQTSKERCTQVPSSLIRFDRPIQKLLRFQGRIASEQSKARRKTGEIIPLTINVSLSFSPKSDETALFQECS
ncbi:hypothetical protein I302_108908 [Kwoniella bestiolae CBS 10118]|uniref:Uncharacterized protein n=1 Tax=Kwoniella bestiolae CBS 10118 TaxID=1296100 RepID=A0A1B9FUF3_9TREE|nr:hypothetical protein I302_08046 [Kwoniella bestiolae CBS 10118]OCF22398.1 hypothetical protein I302_08046 [Kwoniella bestiolae CBS 10118]